MFSLTFSSRYLLIFLKFVQAVIPTIEYDYTRHFTMWAFTMTIKRFSFESPTHTLDLYCKASWLVKKKKKKKHGTFTTSKKAEDVRYCRALFPGCGHFLTSFPGSSPTWSPEQEREVGPSRWRPWGRGWSFWVLTNWLWFVESLHEQLVWSYGTQMETAPI